MPELSTTRARRLRGGLTACALAVVVTLPVGCGGVTREAPRTVPASSATDSAPPSTDPVRAAEERALEVLRRWDDRRAAAFAAADAAALRVLYPEGSPLAVRDVRVLRRWSERGARLADVRHQVVSVRVGTSARDVVVLTVVERLTARAVLAGPRAEPRPLATSRFVRRHLRFVLTSDGWRLSSVRAA